MGSTDLSQAGRKWTLPELFERAGVRPRDRAGVPDVCVASLADDSRRVISGACFVAVRGSGSDGHDFLDAARAAGATSVIVDRDVPGTPGAVVVRVDDTREAIAKLSGAFFGLRDVSTRPPPTPSSFRLIGVTGTNGKTTVAWLLRSILRTAGHQAAMIGTVEYDLVDQRRTAALTTPGPLELCRNLAHARDAGATFGVLEVSSHALDQRRCDGLTFAVGVFTNISGDHLDYHGSIDAYVRAKRRLFEMLEPPAIAVINRDDPRGGSIEEACSVPVTTFGIDADGVDIGARVDSSDRSESRFVLRVPSTDLTIRLPLVGRFNVSNALAAAAAADALGIGPEQIRLGLERVTGVPGRLQRVEPKDCPFSVLVDYSHTDDALRSALEALRPLTAGRLLCVFGCGGDRDRGKRPRMAAAVGEVADVAYVTSDNPRTEDPRAIIEDILPGFGATPDCRVEVEADRRRAIETAIAEARPTDTVLIAGKGHESYQLVGDQVLSFDDVEVARECLQALVEPRIQEGVA